MFAIPQPPDAEMFDGCPVVHLQDSKQDIEFVLSAWFGKAKS